MVKRTENEYRDLERMGGRLGVPIALLHVTTEVFVEGKRISYRRERAKSWNRNAYTLMLCSMGCKDVDDSTYGAGKLSCKDTGAAVCYDANDCSCMGVYDLSNDDGVSGYHGSAGSNAFGVQVGTDNTAEDFDDYVLGTIVAEGAGAGEMNYAAEEVPVATWTGGTLTFAVAHVRYINNNSGGAISVAEIGLVGLIKIGTTSKYVMVDRTVLGAAVSVPDTGQLKVTYTISLVFPS